LKQETLARYKTLVDKAIEFLKAITYDVLWIGDLLCS